MHRFLPFFLFVAFVLVGIFAAPHIGPSWDEPDNIFAAGVYVTYMQQKFDPSILQLRYDQTASVYGERIFSQNTDLERYPPVPLLIGALGVWISERVMGTRSGAEIIAIFHIVSGIFLGITALATYLLSKRLKMNTIEAVSAALITVLSPTVFGHGLSTIKDSAQLALFVTTLYFLVSFSFTAKKRFLLLGAIAWGLALGTKFNAVYIPVIWLLWNFLIHLPWFSFHKRTHGKHWLISDLGMFVLLPSIFLVVIGFITMVIVWPYLWFNPIERFGEVIRYFTSVGTGYQIIWMGQKYLVGSGTSLWWYPLGSFIISTPLIVVLMFFIGLVTMIVSFFYRVGERAKILLLFLWLVIPLLRIFSPTSAYYDGIRHFLEIFPVVSIITVMGMKEIGNVLDKLIKRKFRFSPGFFLLAFIVICVQVSILITYFPYSSGFVNRLVPEDSALVDRDFSGLAIYEGIRYIKETYKSSSIFIPIAGHLSWYYVRPNFQDNYVYSPYDADSVIFINKPSHSSVEELESILPPDFSMVHEIKRGNAVFGWVYHR